MDDAKLAALVDAIVRELQASGAVQSNAVVSPDGAKQPPVSAVPVNRAPRPPLQTSALTSPIQLSLSIVMQPA